jgi:hypothetical protein
VQRSRWPFIDSLQRGEGIRRKIMTHRDAGDFSKKHGPEDKPNPDVANAIQEAAESGQIPCAQVFKIASESNVSPPEAGKTVDLLKVKLAKCQLGLFGYTPEKSIVKPAEKVPPELEAAIRGHLVDGRLPCAQAWQIAEELHLKKMDVSSAVEALKIKIKPCQLGAF